MNQYELMFTLLHDDEMNPIRLDRTYPHDAIKWVVNRPRRQIAIKYLPPHSAMRTKAITSPVAGITFTFPNRISLCQYTDDPGVWCRYLGTSVHFCIGRANAFVGNSETRITIISTTIRLFISILFLC